MTTMDLHVILGATAFLAVAFAAGLGLVIVGIHRGDRGKRLVGEPGSRAELIARRMLTGSLRCGSPDDAEAGQ
jgi:hypothetical protein